MTERTIRLDPDPRDPNCRKIRVSASRWYATVTLDRDNYVDAANSLGEDPELPAQYREALERADNASADRIWFDGYTGGFFTGNGPRFVTLVAQFSHVDEMVEALRSAELNQDYSQLHSIADRLALPIDVWLGPGERELIRGVDFEAPPGVFLRFLRAKANGLGVRLNGRATTGSVWVRPTLPTTAKQLREQHPEQYPGWVDRWTGYAEPEEAPLRPWVGGRDRNLSYGAKPVQFRAVTTPGSDDCTCGMRIQGSREDDKRHAIHHASWAFGISAPKNLDWWGELAVVTTESPIAWRRLTYQVARMPQKENHYDFNSWSYLDEPEVTEDNARAYLLRADRYVIGYLGARDTGEHRRWDLSDESRPGNKDHASRPRIDLIWVAGAYRHKGVGTTLIQSLADDFGCQVADVSWSAPLSAAGRSLALRLSPEGIWVS